MIVNLGLMLPESPNTTNIVNDQDIAMKNKNLTSYHVVTSRFYGWDRYIDFASKN